MSPAPARPRVVSRAFAPVVVAAMMGSGMATAGLIAGCSTSSSSESGHPAPYAREPDSLEAAFAALPEVGGPARVLPLIDNVPSWTYRWAMLDRAARSLDVAYFIVDDDVIGLAFLGKLIEKAQAGVRVRLLIDTRGTALLSPGFFLGPQLADLMERGPIEIRTIGPAVPRLLQAVTMFDVAPLLASNHDKLIIEDDARVVLGGRNIGRDYMVGTSDVSFVFSDVDLVVEGEETVAGLQAAFDAEWADGQPLPRAGQPPSELQPDPLPIIARVMEDWMAAPAVDEAAARALRDDEEALQRLQASLFARALAGVSPAPIGEVRSQIAGSAQELVLYPSLRGVPPPEGPWFDVEARVLDSRTRPHRQEADAANQQILSFVRAARDRIVLLNPYVVLTKSGYDELKALCARHVDVTIFTNSPASSDSSFTQALFLRMWPEILAGCPTARIFVWSIWQPLHGKVAIIDDDITLLGSYNVDYISAYLNGEIGLVMRSVAFADHMRAFIEDEIAKGPPLVLEYRIERDAEGRAVRHPPGHAQAGAPVEVFGPRDHVPGYTLLRLRALQQALDAAGAAIFIEPLM